MAITQLHQQRLQDPTNYASMARQALINSNFDVWQRGVTSALTDITVTHLADRWADLPSRDTGTLPTLTRTRETLTAGALDNSYYFSRLTTNGAGSSFGANAIHLYWNKIEHGTRLLCGASKKVTVSFWARSSISNKKLGLYLTQDYGTGGSPTGAEAITGTNWTLTSSWVKYTFTCTTNTLVGKTFGTNNNDFLQPSFVPMWGSAYAPIVGTISAETYLGSGTIDIAQVQLCAGSEALPFEPKSFSDELIACQRYYEKSYIYTAVPATNAAQGYHQLSCLSSAVTGTRYGSVSYKVMKRYAVLPVIYPYTTGANTGRVSDNAGADLGANSGGITTQSETNFSIYNNSGGTLTTNGCVIFHWTADAEL